MIDYIHERLRELRAQRIRGLLLHLFGSETDEPERFVIVPYYGMARLLYVRQPGYELVLEIPEPWHLLTVREPWRLGLRVLGDRETAIRLLSEEPPT